MASKNQEYFSGLNPLACPFCDAEMTDEQDDSGVYSATCPNPGCILGTVNSIGYDSKGENQRIGRRNVALILRLIGKGLKG